MTDKDKKSKKIDIIDLENQVPDSGVETPDPDESQADSSVDVSESVESSDEIACLAAKLAEMTEHWQRERASFINFKRRAEEEKKKEIRRYAIFDFALDLLRVMDYFESSMNFAENLPENARNVIIGVEYTIREMSSVLSAHGVAPIEVKSGDKFDSSLMEAIDCVESEDVEPGAILSIRRKGWKFHDRILRPAQVVVSGAGSGISGDNSPDKGGDEPENT